MTSTKKPESKDLKSEKEFPYPKCWQDDARAQVLLAPFRERSVNPENYDSKMKFWKDVIGDYCRFKGTACFCKQDLKQTFTREQRVPSCLDAVIIEMQNLKLIRLRADYEYDPANSWSGWALNSFVKKPLGWGHNKIKSFFGAPESDLLGITEYIHLEIVEDYCNGLQKLLSQPPYPGTLYHFEKLKDAVCPELNVSEDCLTLCLLTLSVRNKIGIDSKRDGCNNRIHLVKIPSPSDSSVIITEADHAFHNLMATKESLLKQLHDLEDSIKENENMARQYVSANKRMLAKTYLRKKHLLEKNHEKRSIALHNIETILSNVDEAKHSGLVLDAYRYGNNALKDILNSSNLSYDNVDEVVADIRESVENCKEIQDTLGNVSLNLDTSLDEDSLEEELREILGETKQPKTAKNNNTSENNQPIKVEITDAELLAMLEDLEVEEKSPIKNSKPNDASGASVL